MLGGLYGDLPPPSSSSLGDDDGKGSNNVTGTGSSTSFWSGGVAKMAPSTLRKPSLFAAPPSVLKNQSSASKPKPAVSSTSKASVVVSISSYGGSSVPSVVETVDVMAAPIAPASPPRQLVGATAALVDEYDPARPNDYEDFCIERRKRKAEEEMRREMERRRQEEEERERSREREISRLREVEAEREREAAESRAGSLHISGEEAWKRRALLSANKGSGLGSNPIIDTASSIVKPRSPSPEEGEGFSISKSGTAGLGLGAGGHMTAAQRMMAKMGWKEGQGLGKQEQGITTPLMARKTDRRAGVIVNASAEKKPKTGVSITSPPTRVVLLCNMVGRGEVDDELEDEVASECAKYGTVLKVIIFEITEPDFPPTEAVRIFVEFERSEQAVKAYVDLNGRYFGGRVVQASFFDEERFNMRELAPLPSEIAAFQVS